MSYRFDRSATCLLCLLSIVGCQDQQPDPMETTTEVYRVRPIFCADGDRWSA